MAEKTKTQLHQVIAVEGDLQQKTRDFFNEARGTFGKREHFQRAVRTLAMFDENRRNEETTEVNEMVTTVADKLSYIEKQAANFYDVFLQKEAANQDARADLVVNGQTILENVPATALLGMESKLKELRSVYEKIPTLPPGHKWERQPDGTYVDVNPQETIKTEKSVQFKVVAEATKEHPAQVERWNYDQPVGKYTLELASGMWSSFEKAELLQRLDTLLHEVKKARQRANNTEVPDVRIGKTIFSYLHPAA